MDKLELIRNDGLESHSLYSVGEFEYANPKDKFKEMYVGIGTGMRYDYLRMFTQSMGIPFYPELLHKQITKGSEKEWKAEYRSMKERRIPQPLLQILQCTSKKEQIKLLDGLHLNTDLLSSFILLAGEQFKFTYSQYRVEYSPSGTDPNDLPKMAYKDDDGKIISFGNTDLKDGEIKNAIDQRKVIVSKFLDKGDSWHCFYLTYRGLYGLEKGHPPHIHYISNSFGLTRDRVVTELKGRNYNLPRGPHILYKKR